MNGHLNIDKYDDEADYAIFDDISGGFQFFPSYKGWLGCQEEFECTDKYRAKTTIYWGRPTIMCMNSDPLADPHVDVGWLLLNCMIVHIFDKLEMFRRCVSEFVDDIFADLGIGQKKDLGT
jgi:hypothetical protein